MCDFDNFDDYDGPDDDFSEDLFEEEFEPELDELEIKDMEESVLPEPEGPEPSFNLGDAFVIGGMILGQAYEESLDEIEQRKKKKG